MNKITKHRRRVKRYLSNQTTPCHTFHDLRVSHGFVTLVTFVTILDKCGGQVASNSLLVP